MARNIFNTKKSGFTLIELLVVIAIISLLSTVVLASLNSARARARDTKRAAEVVQIKNAILSYQFANGVFPTTSYVDPLTNDNWFCLGHGDGHDNGRCWSASQSGTPNSLGVSQSFDLMLQPYMPKIPDDPQNLLNKTADAYLYNSNFTDTTSYLGQGVSISNTPVVHWAIESCTPSRQICGGGVWGSFTPGTGTGCHYYCILEVR